MKTVTNDILTISIADHGAELSSIKCDGREYLWGADPEFWKRHSPVLFPIVGSVWQGEYRSNGKTYKMGQHGLARDMDFTLVKEEKDYVEYKLCSNEDTLAKYPYPFILNIGYRLHGRTIDVIWKVTNPSDQEMAFSIGAHPAFYWPMLSQQSVQEGVAAMKEELAKTVQRGYFYFPEKPKHVTRTLLGEGGCVDIDRKETIETDGGYLKLNTELFDHDALVLEKDQVHAVTLCSEDRKPYLTLAWDAPLVGLWSPPKKNAPFVCIEPWYGRADRTNYTGSYEEKDWIQKLLPHAVFEAKYTITIEAK